jgi:hypothetical protein
MAPECLRRPKMPPSGVQREAPEINKFYRSHRCRYTAKAKRLPSDQINSCIKEAVHTRDIIETGNESWRFKNRV